MLRYVCGGGIVRIGSWDEGEYGHGSCLPRESEYRMQDNADAAIDRIGLNWGRGIGEKIT